MGNESDWETYAEEVNRPKGAYSGIKIALKEKSTLQKKKLGRLLKILYSQNTLKE